MPLIVVVGYARGVQETPRTNEAGDGAIGGEASGAGGAAGSSQTLWEIVRRLGPASVLAVIASVMPAIGGILLLVFIGSIGAYLRGHGDLGVVIYTAGFIVLSGLALLPTYAQAILGGWAFGFATGLPAALGGFFGGSLIGYEVARRFASERAMRVLDEHPKWMAVRDALVGEGEGAGFWRTLGIVSLLRLPPNSPFALTNLVMASVRVPRAAFALGTLIGMAPRTAVVLYMATLIQGEISKDALRAAKPWWFFPVAVVMMLAVLAVIYLIGKHALERVVVEDRNPAGEDGYTPSARGDGSSQA